MLNNRFRARIIFMILFLLLSGVFRGLLPETFISVFLAPLMAGISVVAIAYGYRAYVQRGD